VKEKLDQHQMICAMKDLAIELGKTPTKAEFLKHAQISDRHLQTVFGGISPLVLASGLETYSGRVRKIDSSIFEKSLDRHLKAYDPKPIAKATSNPSLLIISDIHWPFHCQRVIDKFYKHVEKMKPDHVILNGDAWDMYSHAKFPRSHNSFTPREEQSMARKHNEDFWREVQNLSPRSLCHQNLGNHDVRPMKRILDHYPEAEDWINDKLRELFTYQGVETNHDSRQELLFGDIIVHHGFKSQLGAHRDHNLQNSISSHTHRPGVVYRTVRGQAIWELNTGYAGDPDAKGLSYVATKSVDWVQSFGAVDEDGPRVILA
jgi:predicted phosphodiesterase